MQKNLQLYLQPQMKNLSLLFVLLLLVTQASTESFAGKFLKFFARKKADYHVDAQLEAIQQAINPIKANISCTTDCCNTLSPSRGPMTYIFYQKTGRLRGGSGEFAIDTHGYSGQGSGYLNPDAQCQVNIGPLPASTYKITYCKNIMHETVQRPCAFYLEPQKPSQMCGRGDFFIHGCNCCTPGDDTQPPAAGCSAGCIVINYANRRKLRVGDTILVQHYEPKGLQKLDIQNQ